MTHRLTKGVLIIAALAALAVPADYGRREIVETKLVGQDGR